MGSGCGRDGGPKRCKTRVHAFGGLRWGNAWAGELRRWCWVSCAQVLQIPMGLEPWRPSSLSPLASLSCLAFSPPMLVLSFWFGFVAIAFRAASGTCKPLAYPLQIQDWLFKAELVCWSPWFRRDGAHKGTLT